MTIDAEHGQWALPGGTLSVSSSGVVNAQMRTNLRNDQAIAGAIVATENLVRTPIVGPSSVARTETGYSLAWPAGTGTRRSLAVQAPAWRRDPAPHLSLAIGAALAVFRATSELQHLAPFNYLVSPVQVFLENDERRERWTLFPVPFVAQFKDIAAASPDATAWLGGEQLARRSGYDPVYMAGAVLYFALVDDASAVAMTPRQSLLRHIAYRTASTAAIKATTATAVPPNMAAQGRGLHDFIVECLKPPFGRSWTPAQAMMALQELDRQLSAPLLAGGWEVSGRSDRALALLEAMARNDPDDAPWRTIGRLRGGQGSDDAPPGPPLPRPTPSAVTTMTLASQVKELAAQGADGRAALAAMVEEIVQYGAHHLAEDERLFMAYVMARWLNQPARARQFLAAPCEATLNRAVRALLLARLHADEAAWVLVAKSCREVEMAIQSLPGDQGGGRGSYIRCFALMLDTAAHTAIVATGKSTDYVGAGWARLRPALELWPATRSVPLGCAIVYQFRELQALAEHGVALDSVHAEMTAAQSMLPPRADNDDGQALPWPLDPWLFA